MRIPYTINKNTLKAFLSEDKQQRKNKNKSRLVCDDFEWDKNVPKTLRELCAQTIAEFWADSPIFDEICLPADKCLLIDILSVDLPLEMTVSKIKDDAYWKRCYETRWPKDPPVPKPEDGRIDAGDFKTRSTSGCSSAEIGSRESPSSASTDVIVVDDDKLTWKRCYLEAHLQEVLENCAPESYDPEKIKKLADLCGCYVRTLILRQLRAPEGAQTDHIPLTAILTGLPKLDELSVRFKQTYIGDRFSWHVFNTTVQDVRALSRGLERCNLTVLRIQNSDVDCSKALIVTKALMRNDSLKVLDFSHCKISNRGVLGLCKLLIEHPCLDSLILTNNKIGPKGAEAISHALEHPNCKLSNLDLRLNLIGLDGGKNIMAALARGAKTLKNLHLAACRLKQNPSIAPMMAKNRTLYSLDISNNKIGEDVAKDIVDALKVNFVLTRLDLRMCDVSPETEHEIHTKIEKNRNVRMGRRFSSYHVADYEDFKDGDHFRSLMSEIDNAYANLSY